MNYFNLIFSNNSILRILQMQEFNKFKLKGKCIEFGANYKLSRNFLKQNSKKYISTYSNIDKKNKKFLFLDLEKKNNHKNRYDNIIIFNVLEHLFMIDKPLNNLNQLLKKKGKIYGSTPFLYRIHGAPNDYCRYTKDYLIEKLKESNFKNISVKELGIGPFVASFSLLRGYLKFLPLIYNFLLGLSILFDRLLYLTMKNDPKLTYPIGYIFIATRK
jgi:hypothetical protein